MHKIYTPYPYHLSQIVNLLRSVEAAVYERELDIYTNHEGTGIIVVGAIGAATIQVMTEYANNHSLRHEYLQVN